MQFDDIQQQAVIDLARFIAPNHFDYREQTPAAYSEIAEPLIRQRMGMTNRELCAAKALALWAQFEVVERTAYDLLVSNSGDTPKTMPEHEGLRIDALRHNVCKAAHDYAKQVGDALLIEAWPAPDWKPNADTQPQAASVEAVPVVPVPVKRGPEWTLKPSLKRSPGYRWPLYQILKAAHNAGEPCPKPREVLEILKLHPQPDIQVMPDGVKYNDGLGNPKEADLRAIGKAIKNLLHS